MDPESRVPAAWIGPDNLRKYYLRCASRRPNHPHWQRGLQVCHKWLDLERRSVVVQSEVDELLGWLRREVTPGSMWGVMTVQIEAWAKQRGLTV